MTKLLTDISFGKNLQSIRTMRGLSQADTVLAIQRLGSPLSRSTYSLIELGRCNLYVSDLVCLQQVFNVDFAEFFKGISTVRSSRGF